MYCSINSWQIIGCLQFSQRSFVLKSRFQPKANDLRIHLELVFGLDILELFNPPTKCVCSPQWANIANATKNKFHVTEGYNVAQAVCKIDGISGSEGSFIFLCHCSTPEQEKSSKFSENVKYSAKLQNRFCNFRTINVTRMQNRVKFPRRLNTLGRAVHHPLERSGWQSGSEFEIWSGIVKALNVTSFCLCVWPQRGITLWYQRQH